MPDSPTSQLEPDFVCACENWMRLACAEETFYKEYEGKRYCVLHFPDNDKRLDFKAALERKLEQEDFHFAGVWFPDEVGFAGVNFTAAADFRSATFSATADFNGATFSANVNFSDATFHAEAHFNFAILSAEAYFNSVTFSGPAHFNSATFSGKAHFDSATFSAKADFTRVTFNAGADFSFATFGAQARFIEATFSEAAGFSSATFSADAIFSHATFCAESYFFNANFNGEADFDRAAFSKGAYFNSATLADYVRFAGSKRRLVFATTSFLNLEFARIEKPQYVSFHTLTLHPHWFINIDPRKIDFTNVEWSNCGKVKPELEILKRKGVSSTHRFLGIACRHLAVNSEENNRYEEASKFRYMAMEARRLETCRGFQPWRLSWWYWLASGYGERMLRAFVVLLGIWLVGSLLYTQVGFARWEPRQASEADALVARKDDVGASLNLSRALTYSAAVMTFQRPEPKPTTTAAQAVVLFETILGPVQAALLALAIRRKFMR